MGDFLLGVLLLALGAAVCFAGLRVFFLALPIWGFIAGFFVGAAGVHAIFGDGFLSTLTGWLIGAIIGIVFSLTAYLFWYAGALIAAGSTGALLGSGLMRLIGVDSGVIVFLVAAAFAVAVAAAAFILALPVYVVVVNTAVAGAAALVAGMMLVFNAIEAEQLSYGAVWAMIDESWFWGLLWLGLLIAGIVGQLRSLAAVVLPDDRWTRVEPTGQPGVSARGGTA